MRYTNGHVPVTLSDAADEIERLNARVAELELVIDHTDHLTKLALECERDQVRAENDGLKTKIRALENEAEHAVKYMVELSKSLTKARNNA
jgi:hypothetical protein